MKNKKQNALSALTLSALAIPSVTKAEVAPENNVLSYRYTQYEEADAPAARVVGGDLKRFSIDVHQFSLLTPFRDKYSLKTDVVYETLSGASPWISQENNGQTELFMSGASGTGIQETRTDISLSPKRYFKDGTLGGTVAMSQENDYKSLAVGLDGTIEMYNSHTTLVGSISISNDQLNPTDAETSSTRAAADGEKKQSFSIYEGVSQIIDKYRAIQVGFGFTRKTGYLSDPYKGDVRPDRREEYTFTTQYRHYVRWLSGAGFHADYRFYDDSWKVRSHTFDIALWQNMEIFGERFTLAPNFRYYMQNAAYFYSVQPGNTSEFRASDPRLSAYGAITIGLQAQYHWKSGTVTFGYSQYQSREDWALIDGDDTETPGLVDFTTVSLGIDYRF